MNDLTNGLASILSSRQQTSMKKFINNCGRTSDDPPAGSSDGLEGSCSTSSGSLNDTVCLHRQPNDQDNRFVGSGDLIFGLSTSSRHFDYASNKLRTNLQPRYAHESSDLLVNSGSSANSMSTSNFELTDHQQQHRRLQQQVHQQLQRVYGQHGVSDRQRFLARRHQMQQAKKVEELNRNSIQAHNLSQFRPTNFGKNHLNQNQQERTYDSLSPTEHSKNEDFYDINGNLPPARRNVKQTASETERNISARCGNLDVLDRGVGQNAPMKRSPAIDRKSQLASLHYATVTAAALLSATADAAAAFVATEKQFGGARPSEAQLPRRPSNAIYSDTYQYVRQKPQPQDETIKTALPPKDRAPQNLINRPNAQLQASNVYGTPVYANTAQSQRLNYQAAINIVPGKQRVHHQLARMHQIELMQSHHQQHMGEVEKYPVQTNLNVKLARDTSSNNSRFMVVKRPLDRQSQIILQHQQQQQLNQLHQQMIIQKRLPAAPAATVQQQAPALALIHQRRNKGIPEIIGKVIIGNPKPINNQHNALELTRYLHARALTNSEKCSNFNDGNQAMAFVGPQQRNRIYGTPTSIISVPSAATTGSNSSVASQLPLEITAREVKPVGCIERICHINLTIFWWALLLVSCAFVATVISIYRYIF